MSSKIIAEALSGEINFEFPVTRKLLERVPDSKLGFQPHPKSMTMAALIAHIAEIPSWGAMTINLESLDLAPPGGTPYQTPKISSVGEALKLFDLNCLNFRKALEGAEDEAMNQNWSLLTAGMPLFTMPRVVALRSFIMNHLIHHRAQLGVYLRLNDISVPSTYGPSADER